MERLELTFVYEKPTKARPYFTREAHSPKKVSIEEDAGGQR